MTPYRDIFFDLDRTLWDFEKNSEAALRTIYERNNLHQYAPSFDVFMTTYRKVNRSFWEAYGRGEIDKTELRNGRFLKTMQAFEYNDTAIGEKIGDQYIELSPYQTNLFPNTKPVLLELKELGFNLHIITNGFKEVQFIKLKNSGIHHFFDDVLCSEEVGEKKPHPKVFQSALQRTNALASSSIMIGDDFTADVIGAEKSGIRGVLFDPENRFKNQSDVDRITQLTEVKQLVLGV